MNKFIILMLLTLSSTKIFSLNLENFRYKASLAGFINGKELGEFPVFMRGQKVESFEATTLKKLLKDRVSNSFYQRIDVINDEWIVLSELPFKVNLDINNFQVDFIIDIANLNTTNFIVDDFSNLQSVDFESEADFSLGINYTLDQNSFFSEFENDVTTLSYDAFTNYKDFILNTRGFIRQEEGSHQKAFRGDTLLTKDFIKQKVRTQLGDVTFLGFGLLPSRNVGGVRIRKEYTIDPTTKQYFRSSETFEIASRSRVEILINGSLVKNEFFEVGRYRLSDLPLVSGINFVQLKITDATGNVSIKEFNIPIAVDALRKGLSQYSFVLGKTYQDQNFQREYDERNNLGYYQYGLSDTYSLAAYGQQTQNLTNLGINQVLVTTFGNFFLDFVSSKNSALNREGSATAVTWQFNTIGDSIFDSMSLNARIRKDEGDFELNEQQVFRPTDRIEEFSVSKPLSTLLTLNLGQITTYFKDQNLSPRRAQRLSLNFRMKRNINLNVYANNVVESNGEELQSTSFFFNWFFEDSSYFVTSNYDVENKTLQTNVTKDNDNKLYEPRVTVGTASGEERESYNASLFSMMPMIDLNIRSSYLKLDQQESKNLNVTLSSASLLAFKNGRFGYAQSRPTNNGFAIFTIDKGLKHEEIAIRSTSINNDTESPLFGDLAVTNIVPYQFRRFQIDTMNLPIGTTLERESFSVNSGLRSGYLIELISQGSFSLIGKLYSNGEPLKLKYGEINGIPIFTDRQGSFFLGKVVSSELLISFEGFSTKKLSIDDSKRGIIDLGVLELEAL